MGPGGRFLNQEVLLSGGLSIVFTPSSWELLRNMPGPSLSLGLPAWPHGRFLMYSHH